MKIAFFYDLIPGGAFNALKQMKQEFSAQHEIDLYELKPFGQPHSPSFEINSFIIPYRLIPLYKGIGFCINPFIKIINLIIYFYYNLKIAKIINSKNYDLCIFHPSQFLQFPFIIRLIKTYKLVYAQEINRRIFEKNTNTSLRKKIGSIWHYPITKIYQFFDKYNLKAADAVWCNSNYTRLNIKNTYSIKAKTMYLGIDTLFFKNLKLERKNIILSIGFLSQAKGHDFVIECLSKAHFKNVLKLHIIAPTPRPEYENFLFKLAQENKVNLKIMIGISGNELLNEYNQAKLVMYFPVNEPFGLVPLEAMACGTPVFSGDEGGLIETVTDNSGGIRILKDQILVSKQLDQLLQNNLLWQELSLKGENYIRENWAWSIQSRKMIEGIQQHVFK